MAKKIKDKAHNAISKEDILRKCSELNFEYISHDSGEYCGKSATIISFICSKHKNRGIQKKDWNHFKKLKKGCPYCSGKKKTTEEFKEEIYKKQPNIEILNEYTGSATSNRILCICKICGYEWDTSPASLRNGSGCPECANASRRLKGRFKGHDNFVSDLKRVQPNIEIISEYLGSHKIIKCKCLIHGCEWESYPANLLNNTAHCPKCTIEKQKERVRDNHDNFINKLYSIRKDVEVIGIYNGYHEKILCKCNIHNNYYYTSPCALFDLHMSCPVCKSENGFFSKGEVAIINYLKQHGIKYESQYIFLDCRNILPLKFDFYLPNNNMCIEFDGEQHFYPVPFNGESYEKAQLDYIECVKRDEIKNKYCKDHGINLIRIPYWDYDKINTILDSEINNSDPQRLLHSA